MASGDHHDHPTASGLSRPGAMELYAMAASAETFTPILLGPGLFPAANDVAIRLANVPTLTELTARLGALPRTALEAAIAAEPEIYSTMMDDARDATAYLRALADAFSRMSDRLAAVGGK